MKLPEPVRHAWIEHRDTLLRIAGEKAGGRVLKGRVLIGGGTILASRWKHRLSEDIDILLPDREVVSDTHPGGPNDLARATGGRIEGEWRDRIKIRVEHGLLDVCAMEPQLRGLERKTTVEDETTTVLSTAQILRGKLNRTQDGLARDAFDLVAAAKAEPRALQHAVNALNKMESDLVQKNLQDANADIAAAAAEALHGVAKEFETDTSQLGIDAAQAVEHSRYTRVRIVVDAENVHIERWTAGGEQAQEKYSADDIAKGLLESGIGEYLTMNHQTHETMAGQGIAELIRQRKHGTIFDTVNANPASEIWKAAETMLAREEEQLTRVGEADAAGDPHKEAPEKPAQAGNAETGTNLSWRNKDGTIGNIGYAPEEPRDSPAPAAGAAEAAERQKPNRAGPEK